MAHHLGRARLTAASPPRGPGKTPLGDAKHSQWDAIRKGSFGLFSVRDCGDLAVSPRRFYTPVRSLPPSRESPSIGSSLTFEGHISKSCGADIHSVHSFLTGTRRLILSAAAWGIHPSPYGDRRIYSVPRFQPGIDPFIGHPSRNGKMPVYRAPCICSPIHRDTTTSMTRGPSAKPPHPSFFGNAKRRTSSRSQSKGRELDRFGSSPRSQLKNIGSTGITF